MTLTPELCGRFGFVSHALSYGVFLEKLEGRNRKSGLEENISVAFCFTT